MVLEVDEELIKEILGEERTDKFKEKLVEFLKMRYGGIDYDAGRKMIAITDEAFKELDKLRKELEETTGESFSLADVILTLIALTNYVRERDREYYFKVYEFADKYKNLRVINQKKRGKGAKKDRTLDELIQYYNNRSAFSKIIEAYAHEIFDVLVDYLKRYKKHLSTQQKKMLMRIIGMDRGLEFNDYNEMVKYFEKLIEEENSKVDDFTEEEIVMKKEMEEKYTKH